MRWADQARRSNTSPAMQRGLEHSGPLLSLGYEAWLDRSQLALRMRGVRLLMGWCSPSATAQRARLCAMTAHANQAALAG